MDEQCQQTSAGWTVTRWYESTGTTQEVFRGDETQARERFSLIARCLGEGGGTVTLFRTDGTQAEHEIAPVPRRMRPF